MVALHRYPPSIGVNKMPVGSRLLGFHMAVRDKSIAGKGGDKLSGGEAAEPPLDPHGLDVDRYPWLSR